MYCTIYLVSGKVVLFETHLSRRRLFVSCWAPLRRKDLAKGPIDVWPCFLFVHILSVSVMEKGSFRPETILSSLLSISCIMLFVPFLQTFVVNTRSMWRIRGCQVNHAASITIFNLIMNSLSFILENLSAKSL